MADIIYKEEGYAIQGAALEVHRHLGCGFLEKVYQEALEEEFKLRGIPYEREKQLKIHYRGKELDCSYFADFVCYGKIIVELKAVTALTDIHKQQVVNYLKATDYKLGFLINFGERSLKTERVVNYHNRSIV